MPLGCAGSRGVGEPPPAGGVMQQLGFAAALQPLSLTAPMVYWADGATSQKVPCA